MTTVLLVDDDPLARRVLELHFGKEPTLKALRARILHASDGRRGLDLAAAEKPDLVVVDLLMPRLDGFGFCRELRATEHGRTTPILIVSGVYRDPSLTSKLLEEVKARFLPKPVAGRDFCEVVMDLLEVPTTPVSEGAATGPEEFEAGAGAAVGLRPSEIPADESPREPRPTKEFTGGATRADPLATVRLASAARPTNPHVATLAPVPASASTSAPARVAAAAPAPAADREPVPAFSHPSDQSHAWDPTRMSRNRTVAAPAETADLLKKLAAAVTGTLAETSLPRLLCDHREAGSTGTLVLRRGRMRKEIFLSRGLPVGADSNLRQEAFGAHLVAEGVIDDARLRLALAQAKTRRKKLGAVLVDMGVLSEEDALRHLEGQVRARIAASLRWRDGDWSFLPGDGFGGTILPHAIDVERTVLAGLRRSATVESAAAVLASHGGHVLVATPRADRLRTPFEAVFGAETLAAVFGAASVRALAARPDADLVLAGAEALLATGMAEAVPAPDAASASAGDRSGATGESAADRGGRSRGGTGSGPSPAAPAEPFSLRRLKELAGAPGIRGGFRASLERPEDSGVVDLGPPAVAAQRAEKRRALLHEALEIHDRSYYELIGVPAAATVEIIRQAHAVAAARFGPEAMADIDLGRDVGKLDEVRAVYARALEVLTDPERRAAYDRRLAASRPTHDAFDAELAFRDGTEALAGGRVAAAAAAFATAADARPDEAEYHAHLGWARFLVDRKSAADARAWLDEALALDPDLASGHDFLGRMAAQLGEGAVAEEHLEKALLLDPTRVAAFEALCAQYAAAGRTADLDRLHRKLLHRLADREPALRLRLWRQLGDLYATTLGDRASAEIAYEAAAALAPNDSTVRRRVLEMNADDPRAWREAARALAAEWRARPVDTQPGHSLMEVLSAAGQEDGAHMAACALALRGLANPEVTSFIERHRARELPRIVAPFDAAVIGRIRHPDEDDDVEEMMGLLAAHNVVAPFSYDELGLDESTAVPPDSQPETFARILGYVAAVLGQPTPLVHVRIDLDRDARLADVRPYVLVVGGALLATDDRIELAFRLGRALAFGNPGRIAGSARPGRLLRGPLLAALTLAGRREEDDDLGSPLMQARVEALPDPAGARVRSIGARLVAERKAVNLSAWVRGLDRTACRVGLLLSGDLLRVGDAVGDEDGPEAVEDLIDFAVSPECSEIRDQLTGRPPS